MRFSLAILFIFAWARPAAAVIQLGNIMPLGDSITVGLGSPSTPGGYRDPLYTLLTDAGYAFNFVGSQMTNPTPLLSSADQTANEGHAGATIAYTSERGTNDLQDNVADWIAAADPNYILLMIGTNDVDLAYPTNYTDSPADPALLGEAGGRLATLISTISNPATGLDPSAHLIVASIPQIGIATEDVGVVEYNRAVLADVLAARSLGERVTFLDGYEAVPADDFSDDLHPDAAGYSALAAGWFHAIQSIADPASGIQVSTIFVPEAPTPPLALLALAFALAFARRRSPV